MRLLRLLAPFLLFLPTPAAAADLVLEAGAHFVEAQVNGQPVRLRVDPEASGYIILNPAAVQRAALRPSLTRAVTYIGPVRLTGRTKSTTVTIGARTDERRIIWMDRDAAADADGIISPADLPYDRVTLNLRPPAAGEQAFTLPMTYQRSAGLVHSLRIGEQEIGFKISTANSHTLATAAAGALIAAQQGGAWAGEASARRGPSRSIGRSWSAAARWTPCSCAYRIIAATRRYPPSLWQIRTKWWSPPPPAASAPATPWCSAQTGWRGAAASPGTIGLAS
jgi:hypothetical protein